MLDISHNHFWQIVNHFLTASLSIMKDEQVFFRLKWLLDQTFSSYVRGRDRIIAKTDNEKINRSWQVYQSPYQKVAKHDIRRQVESRQTVVCTWWVGWFHLASPASPVLTSFRRLCVCSLCAIVWREDIVPDCLSIPQTVFYWNWSSKLWLSRQALKSHKHSSTHADRSLQGGETLIHTAPSLTTGQSYLRASPPHRNNIKLSTGLQHNTYIYYVWTHN